MLTHIVLIRLNDDTTAEQTDALVAGLRALPGKIPTIGTYAVERDLGLAAGNHEVAIVARFASPEDLEAYVEHPAHRAAVRDLIVPLSSERARIQIPDLA